MFYGADTQTFRTAGILRENMTLPELVLWKKLKNRQLFKMKFRKQHPIGFFIVDFYCHELKLVIEIDGAVHDNVTSLEYDAARSGELENFGITVIRFTNNQVLYNLEYVLTQIHETITKLTPLSGGRGAKHGRITPSR